MSAKLLRACCVAATLCGASCLQSTARAELIEWTLTPNTFLKVIIEVYIDGEFSGVFDTQGPGSDSAPYTGTVTTELTDSTIQFIGGNMVAGNTGNWDPLNDGAVGTAPANYGHFLDLSPFGMAITAVRNSEGHLESNPLTLSGPANLREFTFDAGDMGLNYNWYAIVRTTGDLHDVVGTLSGSGPAISPVTPGGGTITKQPGLWTLSLPLDLIVPSLELDESPLGAVAVVYHYVGLVEATAVPEPSTYLLGTIGAAAVGIAAFIRKRRSAAR